MRGQAPWRACPLGLDVSRLNPKPGFRVYSHIGNPTEYRFDPNPPVTKEIIAKAKELREKPEEDFQVKKVIPNLTTLPIIC